MLRGEGGAKGTARGLTDGRGKNERADDVGGRPLSAKAGGEGQLGMWTRQKKAALTSPTKRAKKAFHECLLFPAIPWSVEE